MKKSKSLPKKQSNKVDSFFNSIVLLLLESHSAPEIPPIVKEDSDSELEYAPKKLQRISEEQYSSDDNDEVTDYVEPEPESEPEPEYVKVDSEKVDNESDKAGKNEKVEKVDDDEKESQQQMEIEENEVVENKKPVKGHYEKVTFIDDDGFEVTEEKYIEEEIKEDELEEIKPKKQSKPQIIKDLPPKKKSKKSTNQSVISSYFIKK